MEKVKSILKYIKKEYIDFPLYLITHPIQGYTEFKTEKKAKMSVAIVMLLLAGLVSILSYQYTGPVLNVNDQSQFNSVALLIYTIVPIILGAIGNWSVTTLMDGKGKMKEIFMMLSYSYFPVIVLGTFGMIASNFVTLEESQLVTLVIVLGYAFMAFMIFTGLLTLHEFGLGKTVGSIFMTLVSICIILFLALLIFDLSQQVYGFLFSLYEEIMARFL